MLGYQKFKEFRVINGETKAIYIETKSGREKYLDAKKRVVKNKATKEEMEVLMSMNWVYIN